MLKAITKEKVSKYTTEEKITIFCYLINEIDITQEDIDKHLKIRDD